jgi:sugar O-acyltransferase (sialic acid O-acetyltransferase NeuD family)
MTYDERNVLIAGTRNLLILGAGAFARETAVMVNNINQSYPGSWNIIGYLERGDERRGQLLEGYPIISYDDLDEYASNDIYAVAAIGNPKIKEVAVKDAEKIGCRFTTLIHPSVIFADQKTTRIGAGSIICAGCILAVAVTIGNHVIINFDCTIGHDVIIEDYATLSPGCHISGFNVLREKSFLGTGVVTVEHREVGARSIVGAGAAVVSNIPPDVTAVGLPAKPKS